MPPPPSNCPSCGTIRPPHARYCPSCGQSFYDPADKPPASPLLPNGSRGGLTVNDGFKFGCGFWIATALATVIAILFYAGVFAALFGSLWRAFAH